MKLTLSLGQMNVQLGQPEANLARVRAWTAEAARRGSALVLFPELWSTGYDLENWQRHASPPGAGMFPRLAELAREHHIALGGSVLEVRDGKAYNAFALFDAEGALSATYRKTHLFGLMDEPRNLTAGDVPVVLDLPFGRAGLAICYDLRFPKLFAAYVDARCEAFLLCAEWPNPRLDHWQTLLRARAIEGQAFVIACNRVGGSGTTFFGHSMIVDPWGDVVVEGDDSEGVVVGRIDRARLSEIRSHFPFLSDGRPFDAVETSPLSVGNRC